LSELLQNTRYQIEHQVFSEDEVAVRFHHQLVLIHAFANGNGRHARLLADLLIMRLGRPRLTWGSASESHPPSEVVRQKYLVALREADQGQIDGLIEFARS
jgi:fido (protein-threonine AMPylation protein)